MSAVKGVNKTLIDAGTILKPGSTDGRVKSFQDTYEAAALEAASTITVGPRLPKGAIILAVLLSYDAMGGGVTMDVGDAEDPNRYISAQDVSAAGSKLSDLVDGINYETDESDSDNLDTQLIITTAGAAATGTVKLTVLFTND